jgi:hypothetical protein
MLIAERDKWQFCCQNLTLGALSSRSALFVLVGELFKKFGLVFNTPCISLLLPVDWICSKARVLTR